MANGTTRKIVELGWQEDGSAVAIVSIINDIAGKAQYFWLFLMIKLLFKRAGMGLQLTYWNIDQSNFVEKYCDWG